jgi:hypothetical protein
VSFLSGERGRGAIMARLARVEVFAPDEVAIVHVMNRVVRRCFLLGIDPVTGKNFDHRKVWIEDQLGALAANFGIDLLGFAILSNHFHLILRSRPDAVKEWDDSEIARRWLMLCPVRKTADGLPEEPHEMELNTIRNDPEKLAQIRARLSDIAWWMRLLCQHIAVRANREDGEVGRFFQSRYRAVRLLDEQAILACSAYVDLNPIRGAMADTLEHSDFTSVQRRIQSLAHPTDPPERDVRSQNAVPVSDSTQIPRNTTAANKERPQATCSAKRPADRFLSPLTLDERHGELGAVLNRDGCRASDKGFLPLSTAGYLQLLDWTARQLSPGKAGVTPAMALPIFERLSLDPKIWCDLVGEFGRLFCNVAGSPQTIDATSSRVSQQRYHMRGRTRELFASREPKSSA